MYCSHCKKEVPTQREDFDVFLLIILAIFTAGFGVFIYFIIYFDKPENRCVYCKSICAPSHPQVINQSAESNYSQQHYIESYNDYISVEGNPQEYEDLELGRYCPSCGAKLSEKREAIFCPYCGFNLE